METDRIHLDGLLFSLPLPLELQRSEKMLLLMLTLGAAVELINALWSRKLSTQSQYPMRQPSEGHG